MKGAAMRAIQWSLASLLCFTLPAWAVNCGDILGPGGTYVLTGDLQYEVSPALTVRDGARLDLAGHGVSGCGGGQVVILLDGSGALVRDGVVSGCMTGVEVAGEGGHTVQGMAANDTDNGIWVISDHNRLEGNTLAVLEVAFIIRGHHNTLIQNRAAAPASFSVVGDHNLLRDNENSAGVSGWVVSGDHNRLVRNTVAEGDDGMIVSGEDNLLLKNRGGRFVDTHGDCEHNCWIQNEGGSSDPACILE
jgi:hypothetical protein